MDIEQVRTFLAVEAHGSFMEAANRIHVTQSTVSARIQGLEHYLGSSLFVRNRAGAALTPAGRRFLRHAKNLMLTVDQAKHDVGLPSRFRASITLGSRIALWDGFLPRWAGQMRERAPDVSICNEIGFEDDLIRRLVEGTMDLALMYTPRYGSGLYVEHLFDEIVVLISNDPKYAGPDDGYVFVDWGPRSMRSISRSIRTSNVLHSLPISVGSPCNWFCQTAAHVSSRNASSDSILKRAACSWRRIVRSFEYQPMSCTLWSANRRYWNSPSKH